MERPTRAQGAAEERTKEEVLYTWGDPSLIGREASEDHPADLPCPVLLNFSAGSSTPASGRTGAGSSARRPDDCTTISTISLGATHGALCTRGLGSTGRLGHGDERKYRDPTLVQSLHKQGIKAKSVVCGYFHSMVVSSKGQVYTCGRGYKGFLGHKNQNNIRSFLLVDALASLKVTQVCAARNHSLVVTSDGQVYSFGFPKHGRLGHGDDAYRRLPTMIEGLKGKKVVQASCFGAHNAVLTDAGQVFMWGSGTDGKLGQGDNESHFAPVLVLALEDKGVKSVHCGYDFAAAINVEGHLFTWGHGLGGRLGHGDEENRAVPTLVAALAEVPIRAIACGAGHMAAISDMNVLYTWGKNAEGQLGHGDRHDRHGPTVVSTLLLSPSEDAPPVAGAPRGRVAKVSCGANHTAALVLASP